jgi:small conductance mechanosensitive channel
MTILRDIVGDVSGNLAHWVPFLTALVVVGAILAAARWLLFVKEVTRLADGSLSRQLTMLALTITSIVALVVALPVGDASRSQIFSLIGLVLTGIVALSSTTFVGNAMAGLMLRAVQAFRAGDFLQTKEHFGRVTQRGLLHTEIQTENRDLTTLPNLFLVINPVTVIRYSGTFVSATVSLGYDVPRAHIEEALLEAAGAAQLEEPFVQVLELGDFSVQYRVAGFLAEVKHLLSARSRLRACMLDSLHAAGIEIVSPAFMNQRQLSADRRFIPPRPSSGEGPPSDAEHPVPEAIIFDKAEQAASREQLAEQLATIDGELKALRDGGDDKAHRDRANVERDIERLETRRRSVADAIAAFEPENAEGAGAAGSKADGPPR